MTRACDECLRRSALISALAGRIEILRREKRFIRDVLALENDALIAAVGARPLEFDRARNGGAGTVPICRHDAFDPERLVEDRSAPAVLYLAGDVDRWAVLAGTAVRAPAVAIVGTRRASPEGLEIARDLGRRLSVAGITVVSGMALGVDGAAHDGALAGGARTIAVLAGPAGTAYPRRRAVTHAELVERAAVVSEAPPGGSVFAWQFLARNRIIAGLADMTVVVEAAERSGSLVTAEMALDLGRDVGAVPGTPLSWRAAGTNEMLRDGAAVVRTAEDVIERLALVSPLPAVAPAAERLPEPLREVADAIGDGCDTVSALAGRIGDAGRVQASLTELELRGVIVRVPGGRLAPARAL